MTDLADIINRARRAQGFPEPTRTQRLLQSVARVDWMMVVINTCLGVSVAGFLTTVAAMLAVAAGACR